MSSPDWRRQVIDSPAARAAGAIEAPAWAVGGCVRDAYLGSEVEDVDVAVGGDPGEAARRAAAAARGHAFELSSEFGAWRVVPFERDWQLDVTALRGETLEDDLLLRDFTINAVALALDGGDPIDPLGGLADLDARRLRACGPSSFADDPLRVMRAARLSAALDLEIEEQTLRLAREVAGRAAEPAGERQLAELRALLRGPEPVSGLLALEELGGADAILPELVALRGVAQSPYHQHDVHDHTLEVVRRSVELPGVLERVVGERAEEVDRLMREPLGDELDRWQALRFAALVHDFGKPATRAELSDGRVSFIGHDAVGAAMARGVCSRLRTSSRLAGFVATLTREHLRLGFMVHERPLSRRRVWDYLKATRPYPIEVSLLTVADRLATQGPRTRPEAIESHLELAGTMIEAALDWRQAPPRPPLAGDELAGELGIEPGPELGRLLDEIEAGVFTGAVKERSDAVELARRLMSPSR